MKFDLELMLSRLGGGMATTLWIFGITLLLALPFGMIVAFGRMSKNAVIRHVLSTFKHEPSI